MITWTQRKLLQVVKAEDTFRQQHVLILKISNSFCEKLCSEEDIISQMKKMKMTSEDRACINICGLTAPFMVFAKTLTESLGRSSVKQDIKKNQKNIRLLAYANERLEQYTRRDNLRIFNFTNCEDGELRAKFTEMKGVLRLRSRHVTLTLSIIYLLRHH